jgi:alanine racemase
MLVTRAEIDLRSLRHNYDAIRTRVGSAVKLMAVVKANAYGHGIGEIARALEQFGSDYLGVATVDEGRAVRKAGIRIPILVMGGILNGQIGECVESNLDVTICDGQLAAAIANHADRRNVRVRIHVKIDTGMGRIGVRSDGAVSFVESIRTHQMLSIVGIYSHFATSDERDKRFAKEQLAKFAAVVGELERRGINIPLKHIANSGGILDMPDSYFSMVRPGIMLYGVYPSRETSASVPLKPVMSLKSKVIFTKQVPASTSISYGRKYITPNETTIATLGIGYGDGLTRRLSGRCTAIIRQRTYPIVGTICMDQAMVDVGTDSGVQVGDDAVLIGSDASETITAWDLAERSGTIPYEIFTGITARVPRVYTN